MGDITVLYFLYGRVGVEGMEVGVSNLKETL